MSAPGSSSGHRAHSNNNSRPSSTDKLPKIVNDKQIGNI
jgi:hypothetical protein